MTNRIFAMGGGGFSMSEDPALDRYFFSLAERGKPNVCFLPTASGDAEGYIERFHTAMKQHDVTGTHFSLFRPPTLAFDDFFQSQDIVYVGGGNTFNMLVLWREWGIDEVLKSAMENGTVLGGLSAGAICWFRQGVTDSKTPPGEHTLHEMDCLGWLRGSCCPHYDGEDNRRPEFDRLLDNGLIRPGIAIDDDVGVVFEDGVGTTVVSARKGASAYLVKKDEKHPLKVDLRL